MKLRKFSVPYNSDNPVKFLEAMEPYKEHIDHFYLGLASLGNNHLRHIDTLNDDINSLMEKENNCLEFLRLTRGLYKRVVTLNATDYEYSDIEMEVFLLTRVAPLIEQFGIDGFIVTDYNMAIRLHEWFPDVELHTSCNGFQYNLQTMRYWRDNAGIKVFNPPRDILRTPERLKEMKREGFVLKCIVNESCVYGCPQMLNHCVKVAHNNFCIGLYCSHTPPESVLKCNWVLPRWLDQLDEYVDIYKITYRYSTTEELVLTLDAYSKGRDDINLLDIITGQMAEKYVFKDLEGHLKKLDIPVSWVHDKLAICECRDCHSCKMCQELMIRVSIHNNVKCITNDG